MGKAPSLPYDIEKALKTCVKEITPAGVQGILKALGYRKIDDDLAQIISKGLTQVAEGDNIFYESENGYKPNLKNVNMFLAQIIYDTDGFIKFEETSIEQRRHDPYWGRGFLKLCGEQKYKDAGKELFDDQSYFCSAENRAKLVTDHELAMKLSVWFWKTKCKQTEGTNFGLTTLAINGEIEKSSNDYRAEKRFKIYEQLCKLLPHKHSIKNQYCTCDDVVCMTCFAIKAGPMVEALAVGVATYEPP